MGDGGRVAGRRGIVLRVTLPPRAQRIISASPIPTSGASNHPVTLDSWGQPMHLGLKDKAFVVGGGSKGLGRGIAQALVTEGARVLLVSRDEERLERAGPGVGREACA